MAVIALKNPTTPLPTVGPSRGVAVSGKSAIPVFPLRGGTGGATQGYGG